MMTLATACTEPAAMHIDRIDLYHVAMPLIQPWRTAYGQDAAVESVLVALHSQGQTAWGEACPLAAPTYSPEWAGGVFAVLKQWLAPRLVGQVIDSPQVLQKQLGIFKANPFAKAALDTAWWSMYAQQRGRPLAECLGAGRQSVAVGADLGVADSIDQLLEQVEQVVAGRYARLKLKICPGWDLSVIEAVRQRFADLTLHVDCNGGYTRADLDLLGQLDAYNLAMIEQPLPPGDLTGHARLQAAITTPVCLDESIASLEHLQEAIELGSCQVVNLKPGRVGGLTPAMAIYEACQRAGLGVWVGGMLESAVGARICAALAMLDGMTYPPDLFPTSRFYQQDLGSPPVELTVDPAGRPSIGILDSPGIGTEPNPQQLTRCCVQQATIEP